MFWRELRLCSCRHCLTLGPSEHRDKPRAPEDLRVLSIHGDHRNITEEQALETS